MIPIPSKDPKIIHSNQKTPHEQPLGDSGREKTPFLTRRNLQQEGEEQPSAVTGGGEVRGGRQDKCH